jgi:hypothetical protein
MLNVARTFVNHLRRWPEVKSRSEIWLSVLEDLGDMCSVSTHDDAETLRRRVAAEGDGFLTVTLPSFGKEFERALAEERLSHDAFRGFRRRVITVQVSEPGRSDVFLPRRARWGVPEFLGGFTEKLFKHLDVSMPTREFYLPDRPGIDIPLCYPPQGAGMAEMAEAVFAVRQLCALFSKEKSMAPLAAQRAAIRQYIEVDQELDRPL